MPPSARSRSPTGEGVWLRITNARIVWTRRALFLGRLDIETLAADRIDVLRKPVPEEGMPPPEAGSLQIPELPLAVNIGALERAAGDVRRGRVRPGVANQRRRTSSACRRVAGHCARCDAAGWSRRAAGAERELRQGNPGSWSRLLIERAGRRHRRQFPGHRRAGRRWPLLCRARARLPNSIWH